MRRELQRRNLSRPARSARSGDACPDVACRGRLRIYHTPCPDTTRVRYLECELCGAKPADNKQTIPIEFIPHRPRPPRAA